MDERIMCPTVYKLAMGGKEIICLGQTPMNSFGFALTFLRAARIVNALHAEERGVGVCFHMRY